MSEQSISAAGIKGSALVYALAMFNELCRHEEFFGNDKSKEFAKRIIEIDQKTTLFKDGQYTLAMMLVAEELSLERLIALSMFTREGVKDAEAAYASFHDAWSALMDMLKRTIQIVEANDENSVKQLDEIYTDLTSRYEEARKLNAENKFSKVDASNFTDWKDIVSEKSLQFIKDAPHPDERNWANAKMYAVRDKFTADVKGSDAEIKKLAEAIDAAEGENTYEGIKNKARQVSMVIRGLLQELGKAYGPIKKACQQNGILVHRFATRARFLKQGVDTLNHAYEQALKKG